MKYIDQIILKITSICNLSCDYCYVYNKQDKTYLEQDHVMSIGVFNKLVNRITEYLEVHPQSLTITFHGGEPLLCGKDMFSYMAEKLGHLSNNIRLTIQTNATLIDTEWCEIFKEMNVGVGISLDGNEKGNLCRKFKNGDYAYQQIINGYQTLLTNGINPGVLSVINTNISPVDYYKFLKDNSVKYADCLFPDATYETYDKTSIAIGSWLCQLFDIWYSDSSRFSIRIFETILQLMFQNGSRAGGEMFGKTHNGVLDVTPNGDICLPDTLKITNLSLTESHYTIHKNQLIDICDEKMFEYYYNSHQDTILCARCRNCILKGICGGGLLAHRFSSANLFNNPTVYCPDIFTLIMYIQHRLIDDIPNIVKPITYLDIPFK